MEWVVLKTDLLFFLLLVGMVIYAWSVSVESHLATTWKQVATRPLGMAAASVFSFFLLVAFDPFDPRLLVANNFFHMLDFL